MSELVDRELFLPGEYIRDELEGAIGRKKTWRQSLGAR